MLHVLVIMFASTGGPPSYPHSVSGTQTTTGQPSAALLCLAFLVQFSLSSILLLPPLIMLILDTPFSQLASPKAHRFNRKQAVLLTAEFLGYFASLVLTSTVISGGTAWIGQTWGVE